MHPRIRTVLAVLLAGGVLCGLAAPGSAADWPQYRCDAGRTAASDEALAAELHLQWVHDFGPPRPAYPKENRLAFDASYQPVVLGDLMFVPSMVTDSITALDVRTGAVKWRFHAAGPVRLAPAAWKGKVYFVSDDGFLYCLDAATGRQRWKFRGLPERIRDRKVLGEQRLISLRPARGGPVVHGSTVYFAAGIWPREGIYIHALQAETGKVVWSNTDSNRIKGANPDHNQQQYAGMAPQGHLAVVGDRLIVPNGRQLPGFLDRKTGKRGPYTMGWGGRPGLAKGSFFVAGVGRYLFLSGDLYDTDRPSGYGKGSRLHAGQFARIQMDPACGKFLGRFREPVLTDKVAYYWQATGSQPAKGKIRAFDLSKPTAPAAKPRRKGQPKNVEFPMLWEFPSSLKVHIKAGPRLYAAGKGVVAAVDIPKAGGPAKLSWQARIEGTPTTVLAAGGRLFVVTDRGRIMAFGANKTPSPQTHAAPKASPAAKADQWTKSVEKILRETKATAGYALVLGLADGRMVEELVRQSKLHVIALEADAKKVAALRERFHRAGLYGTRVSILEGDPTAYPLPPYMANLIVSENFGAVASADDRKLAASIFHALRPYGGTACLPVPAPRRKAFLAAVAKAKLPGADAREAGDLVLLTRSGPLEGAADWSHAGADAANTGSSRDERVKAPLKLLWFDGSRRWDRNGTLLLVAGGRMFINERSLHAVDIYTGRHLWSRARAARAAAVDNSLYVLDRTTCVVLDGATGSEKSKIALPAGLDNWRDLRVGSDSLIGAASKHVVALDRRTGKLRWKHPIQGTIRLLAVGKGKVFCVDQVGRTPQAKKGQLPPLPKGRTVAIDAKTGKVLWEVAKASYALRYSEKHDLLVTDHGLYKGTGGSRLRDSVRVEGGLVIVGERLVGQYADTYNLQTGAPISKAVPWGKRGCTRPRMSTHLITTRLGGYTAYFDLNSRRLQDFPGIRPACINNLVPANGLLNAPGLTGGCTCNYAVSSYALVPEAALSRGAPSGK